MRNGKNLSVMALLLLVGCAAGDVGAIAPLGGGGDEAGAPANGGTEAGSSSDAGGGPDGTVPSPDPDGGLDASPIRTLDVGTDAPALGGDEAGPPPPFDATAPALIGKWSFDEGKGTSSADLSGKGHAATLVGGASWAPAGKGGTGLALDGTTGYADVGVSLLDTAQSFSVLCWVRLTVLNGWEIAVSQDDVTGSLFGLKLRGDGTNAFDFDVETSDLANPGFVVAQSTTVAQAQAWVHLAGVYDASGVGALKIYVNGALEANAAIGQSLPASSGHFVIGRGLYNGVTGSFLNGTVDEVEVHAAALTGAQVAAIYAGEK